MSTKTSIFCKIMPEKNQVKNFDPSKNEKNVQICASSHICILCFQGFIDCKESTKNFKRHISSNGPHLVSPQKAKQFSKTQNEVTVKPYIISFFYRHPVEWLAQTSLSGASLVTMMQKYMIILSRFLDFRITSHSPEELL